MIFRQKDILPLTGRLPIVKIKQMDCLAILRHPEKRGALEKMRKVRQCCNQIYR
ncbi:phage integrase central domain-containing protein [Erwinia sorbitola]|uniref:phage integrase central domain-containing protein n=1 Tax=Erwinia sorbitola TaxID=2681984 RepID=UPI0035AC1684